MTGRLKGGDQLMKVTIQGSPQEVAELIKNISSAGDRQDVKKIVKDSINSSVQKAREILNDKGFKYHL